MFALSHVARRHCHLARKVTHMKIVVDYDLCESNAICMQIAPDLFEVRDDDFLYVLNEEPGEDRRGALEECVQRCPKQAIAIAE
jgi:ferredoxin